jgi:hypothetical protein
MSRLDHMTAYDLAIALVKKAGFILDHVAMQSETCYYRHPSIKKGRLLRVSTHRGKGRIGHNGVVSKVTCSVRDMHLNANSVENQVIHAIGRYFLTEPKPSEYRGKRGTWEINDTPQLS